MQDQLNSLNDYNLQCQKSNHLVRKVAPRVDVEIFSVLEESHP